MFLSTQTYKGLQITIKSVVQVTKFLLDEGCEGVLTERFCQDDVEEYFGYQRAQGRRSDNPTAADFGYNDLRIDLFGLYILFSHFRPRDALMGIFLLFFH